MGWKLSDKPQKAVIRKKSQTNNSILVYSQMSLLENSRLFYMVKIH